jgi:hypothetical protein
VLVRAIPAICDGRPRTEETLLLAGLLPRRPVGCDCDDKDGTDILLDEDDEAWAFSWWRSMS